MKKRSRGGGVRLLPSVSTTIVGAANSNSEKPKNCKFYEVIFIDEYDNFTSLGFYKALNDVIPDINSLLSSYGEGQYKLEEGDLKERPSTLMNCFDLDLIQHFCDLASSDIEEEKITEDLHGVSVRGFIYEVEEKDFNAVCRIFKIRGEK